MGASSNQVPAVDTASLLSILWLLFYAVVFYWFYSFVKRLERKIDEIRKLLETRSPTEGGAFSQAGRYAAICKNPLCMRFFIVPGTRPSGKTFKLTCPGCKHENEYESKDLHEVSGADGTALNPV